MRAIILAAGVGARLGSGEDHPPKAMLKFGGKTLFERHLEILRFCGIEEVVTVTGYRGQLFETEISRLGAQDFVRQLDNPHFREGSVVSLWTAREDLERGEDILVMDADVLYDARMITRLMGAGAANRFLMDRDFEPGDEPVKLCLKDGRLVDFHKKIKNPFDESGESVGFFRFSPEIARRLAQRTQSYVNDGRRDEWYEEAVRDELLAGPNEAFGYEDVTGLPWIEIDFAEDVERAEKEILPNLQEVGSLSQSAGGADK